MLDLSPSPNKKVIWFNVSMNIIRYYECILFVQSSVYPFEIVSQREKKVHLKLCVVQEYLPIDLLPYSY